jgi:hypothetical protein
MSEPHHAVVLSGFVGAIERGIKLRMKKVCRNGNRVLGSPPFPSDDVDRSRETSVPVGWLMSG